ncbi:MAG TPA: hypothetical protein VFS00_07580, partial [Polyangiaceae bacterium]|nr:hypothetical protein [Polyangiaceae bacterium]
MPQRRPPLATPRPAAGRSALGPPAAPRPPPADRSAEPSSPFEDSPLPRPPGVPTPVSTRLPRARSADLTPPVPVVGLPPRQDEKPQPAPYGQGPQLFAPLQRDFSPDDATDVLDLREETVLRANLDAAYNREAPGRPASAAPSFDVSLSELPPPGHGHNYGDDRRTARPDAIGTGSMPPPAREREPFFPDERPALSFLEETNALEAFRERAAWLADEAARRPDRAERAGLLLTVSELWAMAGDDDRADAAAAEAVELAPQLPFAHRQARAGAARRGDTAAMLDGLDAETRVAPSPQARAHAAFVGAEICRALGDGDGASKRLEIAARAHPADPRPHIAKAAPALGEPGQAPRYRWADTIALAPLVHASASLAAMRGAFDQAPRSPYEALPRARAAWAEGRPGEAADALTALQQLRTIGEGALWLAASLAGLDREARAKAIEPLESLQNGPHPVLASRALADAKLELGDVAGARGVITVGRTFGDAEQVAFGALTGARVEDLAAALSALEEEPERAPLAAAVEAMSDSGGASTAV